MPTPTPTTPTKGAGTTFWIYTGTGDAFDDPLSDVGWTRTAQIKEITPGELTAESYDDSYIDDDAPDWDSTAQGLNQPGNRASLWHGNQVNLVSRTLLTGL